ncbi:MAG: response regulator transcription factor [Verrucomicrobia bacterium]|nr:response regulator transcription factor [Verrucomicrobiota bacterium]
MAARKIRLLLVDDHPFVREGIKSHLATEAGIAIVGEAGNGEEALRQAARLKPEVVLMDISMPGMSGLEAISRLRKKAPRARVLVLTMHDNREYITQVFRLGARGFVRKDSSPDELVRAIRAVSAGEVFCGPGVSSVLVEELAQGSPGDARPAHAFALSDREREVLVHVAEGLSNKDIARRLGVGVRTVETHREHIMHKLDIHTVAGLTRFAVAQGMVQ